MLSVSPEQQTADNQVVSIYIDDFLTQYEEEWEWRYYGAAERVEALYAEFTPDITMRARMVGKMLGAGGMAFIETRYGADESSAQLYGGYYETDVLSVQHNATHSWNFMRNMFQYATFINGRAAAEYPQRDEKPYDDNFFLRVPHIAAYHDSIMGNGRGHDERQAALFAGYLAQDLGVSLTPDAPTMAAIEATIWDPHKERQLVYPGEDLPLYRTAARVADLLTSTTAYGAYESLRVIMEDMTKKQHDRALMLAAREQGFNLQTASMAERAEFIDRFLRRLFGTMLEGQAKFLRDLPLADPTVKSEFSGYTDNADILQYVSDEYRGGVINGEQVVKTLSDYAGIAA